MSDEKRDTPTSSLTQAGDIVDTFWDINQSNSPVWMATRKLRPCRRRMAVIQPLRSVNYRCFLALIKPTNPLLSRLLTMQALMTSRPTWCTTSHPGTQDKPVAYCDHRGYCGHYYRSCHRRIGVLEFAEER